MLRLTLALSTTHQHIILSFDAEMKTASAKHPAGKDVEDTLQVMETQTRGVAAQKVVVEGEEAAAAEKAAAAKIIKVRNGVLHTASAVMQCSTLWAASVGVRGTTNLA